MPSIADPYVTAPKGTGQAQKPGVQTQHVDYINLANVWAMCRDVSKGQRFMHSAGNKYIAQLRDQSNTEYQAYVARAPFYNATWRTIAGLQGMMFRKPPDVVVPKVLEPMLEDITLSGVSLHLLALKIAEEVLTIGRVGVLADYPRANVEGMTQADAEKLNLRPTLSIYQAESITNWKTKSINNKSTLILVVLAEKHYESVSDFSDRVEQRWRVLDLVEQKADDTNLSPTWAYRQRMFRIDKDGGDEKIGDDVFPLMNNKEMDFIPFAFIGPDDTTPEIDEPPLIDLVYMNIAHYKVTADYEHGCHFTGLPTPVVSGYTPSNQNEKLYIGSTTAWVFPDPAAHASFLSFGGEGMSALVTNLEKKEQQMAVLGARMLEALKRGIESAQTASIHRVGEESVLASVAQAISIGLTRALQWFADWVGATGEVKIDLNRDFYPVPMTAQTLTALVSAWQQGAFSDQVLFEKLKQGELYGPEDTLDAEQQRIADSQKRLQGIAQDLASPAPTQPPPTDPNVQSVKKVA